MNDTALRLADELDEFHGPSKDHASYAAQQAAVELRRLHSELERKSDAIQRLWKERDELRTLNAELVEALQAIVKSLADQDDEGLIEHAQQMIDARAAIAKATGEQT